MKDEGVEIDLALSRRYPLPVLSEAETEELLEFFSREPDGEGEGEKEEEDEG